MALRVSYAKGFRAPSLKELYLDFVDLNHNIHGNEDLQAETSQNINFAYSYNHQSAAIYNWGIEFGLFYNHINNKIELMMVNADPLIYSYINVDEFATRGFELSFNNRIYPWLQLKLGLSVTGRYQIDSEITNNPGYINSTDVLVQMHYWWQKPDLHFSLFYKYNGSYPYLVLDENEETAIASMEPYNSLDININRWFWKRRINVQIGGKNLFDVTNVNVAGSGGSGGVHSGGGGSVPVTWGRTFFARVVINFSK
jgi:outer membrane receptor for ferrienterochelin and colicins